MAKSGLLAHGPAVAAPHLTGSVAFSTLLRPCDGHFAALHGDKGEYA